MTLQSLGYMGVTSHDLDEWKGYATKLLGMQLVDETRGTLAFRMDDRKQRLMVRTEPGPTFYGWEVESAAALDALAAHLERSNVPVARGSRALAGERHVEDLIVFADPLGNRVEAFVGAHVAPDPFTPGRSISGFRTGPLGMGHAVLTVERLDDAIPFYQDILGFRLSDYFLDPFKAFFFHVNPRHHSLAFIETGANGVHHLMVELYFLDDVGQGYDLALRQPELIGTSFGRHVNDYMTSFYTWSPSRFLVEYGWGGRMIDPDNWTPHQRTEGPSLWGHDRAWLTPEALEKSRDLRIAHAAEGLRIPVQVIEGNHQLQPGVCPWWDAAARARKAG